LWQPFGRSNPLQIGRCGPAAGQSDAPSLRSAVDDPGSPQEWNDAIDEGTDVLKQEALSRAVDGAECAQRRLHQMRAHVPDEAASKAWL
jgi:hypothetical protein